MASGGAGREAHVRTMHPRCKTVWRSFASVTHAWTHRGLEGRFHHMPSVPLKPALCGMLRGGRHLEGCPDRRIPWGGTTLHGKANHESRLIVTTG